MRIEKKHIAIAVGLMVTFSAVVSVGYLVYIKFKKKKTAQKEQELKNNNEIKSENDGKN